MFDLFKKNTTPQADDAKSIRDMVMQTIKNQLRKAEGGEGSHIRGIQVYVSSSAEDQSMYESALYIHEEEKLRTEIQRLADDYAVGLPSSWKLEVLFVETLPTEATLVGGTKAAVFLTTTQTKVEQAVTAYLHVRNGEAEKAVYEMRSAAGRINIGREARVQTGDGFYRVNQVAFPGTSADPANKFVSRQHAHIEFNAVTGQFILFADEGGVPPRNKIKVLQGTHVQPIKLYSTQLGHALQPGDQILLGDAALLEFRLSADD
jgi:DNA-binding protein Fis